MAGPERPIWFAGDLDDPWVASIADALPRDAVRIDCPAGLPESWPSGGPPPATLVLHRSLLTPTDARSLARLKERCPRPARFVLCVGPHARYADVDAWSRMVDVVIPEATASEVVLRQSTRPDLRPDRPAGPRGPVVVVSGQRDLRLALSDACRSGGFSVEAAAEWREAPPGVCAWDVPILEPSWPEQLAVRARVSPVVALLGFADRASVAMARAVGAAACLDSTCEVEDLLATLDRVSAHAGGMSRGVEPAHDVPPMPRLRAHRAAHEVGAGVADRGSDD